MTVALTYISDTKRGFKREVNKDRIYIINNEKFALFILFDGVSSSENAIAAIDVVKEFIDINAPKYLTLEKANLSGLMYEANVNLLNSNISNGASTYALIFINKTSFHHKIEASNLGDTRIYAIKKQSLNQITNDHLLINSSNVITKYLGMIKYDISDFETANINIQSSDRFLICSDGFYEILEKNLTKTHRLLNFKKLGNTKRQLANEVVVNNNDDASYILIDIQYV